MVHDRFAQLVVFSLQFWMRFCEKKENSADDSSYAQLPILLSPRQIFGSASRRMYLLLLG